ncbi:MAG: hypothetical protein MJY62_05840, partial [Bacteroidales bacterium]|nr:hypothetical protein [Bacteroidales bacterium]
MRHTTTVIIISFVLAALSANTLRGQDLIPYTPGQEVPSGYEVVDSLVNVPIPLIDTSLVGRSVFDVMPSASDGDKGTVSVHQSRELQEAMASHVLSNGKRTIPGFRVRIFFDNKRTSRGDSESARQRFERLYPGIKTYRTYSNPYFKVTVGNFRTRSEAMEMLSGISRNFPSAFV